MFKFNKLHFAGRDRIKIRYQSSDSVDCVELPKFKETPCKCCGTLLRHPNEASKFKCTICEVTVVLMEHNGSKSGNKRAPDLQEFSHLVKECLESYGKDKRTETFRPEDTSKYFIPVEQYIAHRFDSAKTINESFKPVIKDQIIDYEKAVTFYNLIGSLPTKRPIHLILRVFDSILKRPKIRLAKWEHYLFIFFILEVPSLRQCINNNNTLARTPKLKTLSYEIIKHCIGYLGSMESKVLNEYKLYLERLHPLKFQKQWDILNLYLSYQFQKIGPGPPHSPKTLYGTVFTESSPVDAEKDANVTYLFHPGRQKIPLESRFRIEKYGIDWHVRTVCQLMDVYFHAHCEQPKCDLSAFYNMVIDFIDYKRDYMMWHRMNKEQAMMIDNLSLMQSNKSRYTTMCQYPFLMSLGIKIAILEFETGKMMEHNAEQAFLKALDSRKLHDVHLRVKVRRSHVTQDSLLSIQRHSNDLKKSLRVEFSNEPGIDAGGLKKEWFLLLTRELFHPKHGLFQYVEESRLSWFAYGSTGLQLQGENNGELYYLFGVVLGLAIYNSTILDLHFPKALYKKLCSESITFADYEELYPDTAKSLKKMLNYEEPDFSEVFGLTFETTYFNVSAGTNVTKPLCKGGESIEVTLENRNELVKRWVDFYMNEEVSLSFNAFHSGFTRVIGDGLAFPMFKSCEVERLICGSVEQDIDFPQLRAVTKYQGGFHDHTPVVEWLWDVLPQLSQQNQRQFLHFVTGSDRIPVTGLATLPFKITRTSYGPPLQLPTAHTCFNELCLYEYGSRETLKSRLTTALEMYEGYGFK
ncbi:unnamed protein product [Kluyveromyces dobzhanskii CBS 2104]|uniref:HECT-type E3 ubiquitin transferase n=1 Tax=Kluyveromyces dobzhanskii CBS 2104 TaxID=1427455 RepID=A0A0A8LAA4_9SACH|nr:unnamed protein product [Kluyveromyces dobzhanskii CBS 2104]